MRWLLAALALLFAAPIAAQAPSYDQRAAELAEVLSFKREPATIFAPAFIAQIPATQLKAIAAQLTAQYGPLRGIARTDKASSTVELDYEKATVSATMTLAADPPHQIIGLLVTSTRTKGDNAAKIAADVAALPGKAGLLVRRIDRAEAPLLAVNQGQSLAVGSSFKLWILADLTRAVKAGERRWHDVVRLEARSLPSGITQNWPRGSPVTIHSHATLMISISDNTASDTLLRTLGRDKVGAMVATTGHSKPAATLPILTTSEAFALKMTANDALRPQYVAADPATRAKLLVANRRKLDISAIDFGQLGSKPRAIDTIEWFASPADMAATLDWFRRANDRTALDILAINPGLRPGTASRFAYAGYKGGSENGVLAMNLLIATKTGAWYAVTGAWNDTAATLDNARFESLVERAVALIP